MHWTLLFESDNVPPVIIVNRFDWSTFKSHISTEEAPFYDEFMSCALAELATPEFDDTGEESELQTIFLSPNHDQPTLATASTTASLKSDIMLAVHSVIGRGISEHEPLFDAGIDSLGAVELRDALIALPAMSDFLSGDSLLEAVPSTIVFDFPNVTALSDHLLRCIGSSIETSVNTVGLSSHVNDPMVSLGGVAAMLPNSTEDRKRSDTDALSLVPGERWHVDSNNAPHNARFGGFMLEIGSFDNEVFSLSAVETKFIDPQHCKLLELACTTLFADICNSRGAARDTNECLCNAVHQNTFESTSVAVGISGTEYAQIVATSTSAEGPSPYMAIGGFMSVACGRISFAFGWHGPSFCVDTACSSALVAVHITCNDLKSHSNCACDGLMHSTRALCAGANITLLPTTTAMFSVAGMLAWDGRCKTLDSTANGYVRAEVVVTCMLNRHARSITELGCNQNRGSDILIPGSAVNQDGRSSSLTAPNGPSQRRVMQSAMSNTDFVGSCMSLLQLHGTGTSLGDPIEIGAASAALVGDFVRKKGALPLALGAPKSRIGHAEPASGAVGILFASMGYNAEVRPTMHLRSMNPHLDVVMRKYAASMCAPRQACSSSASSSITGTSAFAFQGTNSHVVNCNRSNKDLSCMEFDNSAPTFLMIWNRRRRWIINRGHPMIEFARVSLQNYPNVNCIAAFEIRICGVASLAHLADHRVIGHELFPAAGFMELATASSRGSANVTKTETQFNALCTINISSPLIMRDGENTSCNVKVDGLSGVISIDSLTSRSGKQLLTNTHVKCQTRLVIARQDGSDKRMKFPIIICSQNAQYRFMVDEAKGSVAYGRLMYDTYAGGGQNSEFYLSPPTLDAMLQLGGPARLPDHYKSTVITRVPVNIAFYRAPCEKSDVSAWCVARGWQGNAGSTDNCSFSDHIKGCNSGISTQLATLFDLEMRPVHRISEKNANTFVNLVEPKAVRQIFYRSTVLTTTKATPRSKTTLVFDSSAAKRLGAASFALLQSNSYCHREGGVKLGACSADIVDSIAMSVALESGNIVGELCSRDDRGFVSQSRVERACFVGKSRIVRAANKRKRISIISGGLGSIGVIAAAARFRAGVDKVILLGRSGREATLDLSGLSGDNYGIVSVYLCDISIRDDSKLVSRSCMSGTFKDNFAIHSNGMTQTRCPFFEWIHASGALCDAVIDNQSVGSLAKVMGPKKSDGIAQLNANMNLLPLVNSILFSSIAALIGSVGQANYVVANKRLDTFAIVERRRGNPTTAIQWGAWGNGVGGMASGDSNTVLRMQRIGVGALRPEEGILALMVLSQPPWDATVMVNHFNWEKFEKTTMMSHLTLNTTQFEDFFVHGGRELARVDDNLKLDPGLGVLERSNLTNVLNSVKAVVLTLLNGAKDDIGDADPLMDSGIDSLGAVELRQALAARFDMVLPPTLIFDYPSIGALAKFLYESKVPAEIHGVQKIFPQRLEGHSTDIPMSESHAVEISCIACEYPRGITNLSDLVKAFLRGVEFQEIMSNERFDPETLGGGVRTATILDDIDAFDAEMFRIVDAEAVAMDPQQRKLLDISLRILTSSPIGTVEAAVGSNTAVYLGVMWTEYQQLLVDVGAPQNVSIMIYFFNPTLITLIKLFFEGIHWDRERSFLSCWSSIVHVRFRWP